MAEKTIKTRIQERFATFAEWQTVWQTFKPLKGEVCKFQIPANTEVAGLNKSSVARVVSKTGDGTSYLIALPWDSAIVADETSLTVTASNNSTTTLAHGKTFTAMTDVAVSNHLITKKSTVFTLPTETGVSVSEEEFSGGTSRPDSSSVTTLSHGGKFTVVDEVKKGSGTHEITAVIRDFQLPTETTLSKETDSNSSETLAHGGTFTAVVDTTVSDHKITDVTKTFTLPVETEVSVNQLANKSSTSSHGGAITVVTGVTKGNTTHKVDVEKTVITLPTETAVSVDTLTAQTATLAHGGTFSALTSAVKGNTSHNIDVKPTTFTMPSETSVSVDKLTTQSATLGYGGTFTAVTAIAKGNTSHNVDYTPTTFTLPGESPVTVDQATGSKLSPSHGGTFNVVTAVNKGSGTHNIDVTTNTVQLPSVEPLQSSITDLTSRMDAAERHLIEVGDLREVSHSFVTAYTLSSGVASKTVTNVEMFDTFLIHDTAGIYNVSVTYDEWSGVVADYRILAENTGAHVITISRKDGAAITSAELSTINSTVEHIKNGFSVYFNKLHNIILAQEIDPSDIEFNTDIIVTAE